MNFQLSLLLQNPKILRIKQQQKMEGFEMTQSHVQQEEQNQFLDDSFRYENCPHCERNFFLGKLKYHLKLCKANNPMTKSPLRKTKRSYLSTALEKSQISDSIRKQSPIVNRSPENKYKKCQFCKATFPVSILQRHSQKCNLKFNPQIDQLNLNELKSKTKIQFDFKKNQKQPYSALPRIRNSAKVPKKTQRKFISQDLKQMTKNYFVKIREDLSCFKKALQVQQIECPYCTRKFSKQASLRHIPICQKLKNQQIYQIAIKKHSKSDIYKSGIPIKESTLFRSKFLKSLSENPQNPKMKSARAFQSQQSDRQKFNQTPLVLQNKFFKVPISSQVSPIQAVKSKAENKLTKESIPFSVNEKQAFTGNMNMTFSRDLNKIIKNVVKQKQSKQQKKLEKYQVHKQNENKEQNYLNVENQFFDISQNKKNLSFKQLNPSIYLNQLNQLQFNVKQDKSIDVKQISELLIFKEQRVKQQQKFEKLKIQQAIKMNDDNQFQENRIKEVQIKINLKDKTQKSSEDEYKQDFE